MKVEYLMTIDSEKEMRNESAFNNLLKTNADIEICGESLTYKGLAVQYEIQEGWAGSNDHRFFHLKFECAENQRIEEFQRLLKAIRTILNKVDDSNLEVLLDGVSLIYAQKAYPVIHEMENLMRKLIAKFMLVNVGLGWTRDTLPDHMKKPAAGRGSERKKTGYLYDVDFKDLSSYLFDKYATSDIEDLREVLRSHHGTRDQEHKIPQKELDGFVPKSNWERYFHKLVDCQEKYLKDRWSTLNTLRCQVAHNSFFTKTDYESVLRLDRELRKPILNAILNLDKVRIPEEKKDKIAEIAAIKTHPLYIEYLQKWKEIEEWIMSDELVYERILMGTHASTMELLEAGKQRCKNEDSDDSVNAKQIKLYETLIEAKRIATLIQRDTNSFFGKKELLQNIETLDLILAEIKEREQKKIFSELPPEERFANDPESLKKFYIEQLEHDQMRVREGWDTVDTLGYDPFDEGDER